MWSVTIGMTGATSTPTGTPASCNARTDFSRVCGADAPRVALLHAARLAAEAVQRAEREARVVGARVLDRAVDARGLVEIVDVARVCAEPADERRRADRAHEVVERRVLPAERNRAVAVAADEIAQAAGTIGRTRAGDIARAVVFKNPGLIGGAVARRMVVQYDLCGVMSQRNGEIGEAVVDDVVSYDDAA